MSIRSRLLTILLSLFTLTSLFIGWFSYDTTYHEIEELYDAELAQVARVILAMTELELKEKDMNDYFTEQTRQGHRYEKKIAFQIWQHDKLLLHSTNIPDTILSEQAGYSEQVFGTKVWRIFHLIPGDRGIHIITAESNDVRSEMVYEITLNIMLPILLVMPMLAIFLWLSVSQGLSPLYRLANEVAQRSPQSLDPIGTQRIPVEVQPLVAKLNRLLLRLGDALDNERRFTADAAHELRTPLASLKTQAQVALRARHDQEKEHALKRIIEGVDRATHLVSQLLTLARLEPETSNNRKETIDLHRCAESVLADLVPTARSKDIELSLEEMRAHVLGLPSLLSILLRNLIDNAIRYTPPNSEVNVAIRRQDNQVCLEVADSGPGIPADERQRVLGRFYRRTETAQSYGSGLGLSIVQRICELHNATLQFDDSSLGGLLVRICLARAEPPEETRNAEPAHHDVECAPVGSFNRKS